MVYPEPPGEDQGAIGPRRSMRAPPSEGEELFSELHSFIRTSKIETQAGCSYFSTF